MLAVRENLLKLYGSAADETIIDQVLRHGTASISDRYLSAIQSTARDYVGGIFRRLREHEYDPELMKLYVVGDGGCLIKNFGEFDTDRVVINEDICATAKGYEFLPMARNIYGSRDERECRRAAGQRVGCCRDRRTFGAQ